jgi:sphinganine-1-phosphate aldolase
MLSGRTTIRPFLDAAFSGKSAATSFYCGVAVTLAAQVGWYLFARGRLIRRAKLTANKVIRFALSIFIEKEIAKALAGMSFKAVARTSEVTKLPEKAMGKETVLEQLRVMRAQDDDYRDGTLSGTVYHGGDEHTKFINEAMELYQWTNPLHTENFPSVRVMEAEIVKMVVNMYNGSDEDGQCGAVTTGGSESIMMAVKVYRDMALHERGITSPNLVVPITIHPAFDKACEYFRIEIIKVPVDGKSGKVCPAELERYINQNTIAIAGSAPNYPYGTVDPLEALSEIAVRRDVPMHVDACLGGFVVPFLSRAGVEDAPVADFRLPGVTTISADTHKFGFAPKGTSCVLYRSQALRRYQFFTVADWPGGLYASPSAPGSKPGNVIAGTWAAMMAHGYEGYVEAAKAIEANMRKVKAGIEAIEGMYILGSPQASSVAFSTDEVDIYQLMERIQKLRGWTLNSLQFPHGAVFSLTLVHTRGTITDQFLEDLRTCFHELVRERDASGKGVTAIGGPTMYGGQQKIGDRTILQDMARGYFNAYYNSTSLPAKKE